MGLAIGHRKDPIHKKAMEYYDKPFISFTDLTTVVIMQESGIRQILIQDEHFIHVGMGFEIFA
ncbi:MAG: hypothetical protein JETT_3180 [Candidatus Jettenia ecosi]|uniref:Uncharacterized protein n=1 Tax=Candidatus Jettenia ecosi TaxID=2494326 RepID=A0A533Q7D7_9BACT|nr:MAG: hypothetical protein JETT_3180 [Candidatus Jettenia ecosi]